MMTALRDPPKAPVEEVQPVHSGRASQRTGTARRMSTTPGFTRHWLSWTEWIIAGVLVFRGIQIGGGVLGGFYIVLGAVATVAGLLVWTGVGANL